MLRYILGSQRKYLLNLMPGMIPQMISGGSNTQSLGGSYLRINQIIAVLDHDPSVEAEFAIRASQTPTMYAFHGTGADCIYSLQRNGLRNLSNTGLMTAGAAYGPGIYISCNFATA